MGGANYGQGSSREHAALVPLYLGIRAVAAKSFARMHKANLTNSGILPLTFADENDYDRIDEGDAITLLNVRDAILNGGDVILKDVTKNIEITLKADLSDRARHIILAGGLLNYTAQN